MKSSTLVIISVVGIFLLLLAAIIASRVGGIAIRNSSTQTDQVILTVSSPASRGSQVTVRWTAPDSSTTSDITLQLRDDAGEHPLGTSTLGQQLATVVFPCATNGDLGTLIMRDSSSGRVLAQQSITLLPADRDCIMP